MKKIKENESQLQLEYYIKSLGLKLITYERFSSGHFAIVKGKKPINKFTVCLPLKGTKNSYSIYLSNRDIHNELITGYPRYKRRGRYFSIF